MRFRSAWLLLLVAGLIAFEVQAVPVVYTVDLASSAGVDVAIGCTSSACSASSIRFAQDGVPDELVGTITIDTDPLVLQLSFSLSGNVQHDAANGGVPGTSEVDFIGIVYSATNLLLSGAGPVYSIVGTTPPDPRAGVTGNIYENGADTGADLNLSARVTGNCEVLASSVLCGLTVGGIGFGPIGIGDPDTALYFRHTLDVTANQVPEPSISLLIGLGIAGLAFARSRA